MEQEKKLVVNGIKSAILNEAGIPSSYHSLQYSDCVKKLEGIKDRAGVSAVIKIDDFINRRNKGLIIKTNDNTLPYILFRKYMIINELISGNAKVCDAYGIYDKQMDYSGEELFGILRIDVNEKFKRNNLLACILKAYRNDAVILLTTMEKNKNILYDYFENIWDILERDFGVFTW